MVQWKGLLKLMAAMAPAAPIVLGIVLRTGWLAAAGIIAYLVLILAVAFIYSSGKGTRLTLNTLPGDKIGTAAPREATPAALAMQYLPWPLNRDYNRPLYR
jgi:hypothetical protein